TQHMGVFADNGLGLDLEVLRARRDIQIRIDRIPGMKEPRHLSLREVDADARKVGLLLTGLVVMDLQNQAGALGDLHRDTGRRHLPVVTGRPAAEETGWNKPGPTAGRGVARL